MPALTLDALRTQIDKRRLAPVYLFVGEDATLMDRMVDALEATIDEADRPFAVDRLFAGEPSGEPLAIASVARSLPMLGDRRLVVVARAERLLKPKRGGASADDDGDATTGETEAAIDAGPIEGYLEAPSASTTLVFVASEIDRGRRLTKRLLEVAQLVTFAGLGIEGDPRAVRQQAVQWLKDELVKAGRSIERDAAETLAVRAGGEISKLRGDVEKLLLFIGDRKGITLDDVMEVVSDPNAVEDDWAVVNAIGAGDAARALVETAKRFERGDSAHAIVGQLRWWVSAKLAPADAARVKSAYDALLRTDLALKSSGGDEQVLVERLVVELTGRPVPSGWGYRR